MSRAIKSRLSGRLSVLLVTAMLLPMLAPAFAAEKAAGNWIVISDFPGDNKISAGKGEGVEVGTKGTISRNGKDIARYEVTRVEWGYSRISVSDLSAGEVVRVGDKAGVTSVPASSGPKKGKSNAGKIILGVLAVGAAIALLSKSGRSGSSSAATIPGTGSVTLATQKTSIPADGASNTILTATVKDSNSVAVPDGTAVTFTTTLGTIIPAAATTTGGVATATLTAGMVKGTATVTAASGGKTATVSVTLVSSTAGGDSTIVLAAGPPTIQVSGSGGAQTQSTITATCRDALGNLANGGTITFTSDIGSVIGSATIGANGVATTTFSSNVTGQATITASWSGITATTTVAITPGPPYTVTVDTTPSAIQCDGNSFATIRATVRDIAGNLVTDGTVVTFSVQADTTGGGNGTITPQAQTTAGIATVVLFSKTPAGVTSKAGTATVVAQVLRAGQPVGIPVGTSDIENHATQVQFLSLDVAELHMGANPNNVRGWDVVGNRTTIGTVVYDANHNPVPDGTAVYFTTNHGMIYGNGGTVGRVTMSTTVTGRADATLVTDASGDASWHGFVDITATCGAVTLTEPGLVIFSGWPSPSHCSATASPSPAVLTSVGGQASIAVLALDVNDNPVVDGTKVSVNASKGGISAANGNTTVGGFVMFTLATSTDASAPTQLGPGTVTIAIDSGGLNPETGGQPVVMTVPFTVVAP